MIGLLAATAAGALFGVGLALSGLGDPAKVQGFLDFLGAWDPSLAFVMGGAVVVYAIAFRLRRGKKALLSETVTPQPEGRLTASLFAGAAVFGVGWGLLGYCPGPALLGLGAAPVLGATAQEMSLFVPAMLLGGIIVVRVRRHLDNASD